LQSTNDTSLYLFFTNTTDWMTDSNMVDTQFPTIKIRP
jgi:hypothetical protein